jgi:hypothetical protein
MSSAAWSSWWRNVWNARARPTAAASPRVFGAFVTIRSSGGLPGCKSRRARALSSQRAGSGGGASLPESEVDSM